MNSYVKPPPIESEAPHTLLAVREREGGTDGADALRSRRLQNVLFVLALLGIACGTVLGFLFARREARRDAHDRVIAIASTAGISIESLTERSADALGGASAVVGADGTFDLDVFEAYARDLSNDGPVRGVALIAVVTGDERDAFEERIGRPIQALSGLGRLTPAPESDLYYPVLSTPGALPGFTAVGLDYRSDPVRGPAADAAAATGSAVVSGTTILPRSGERGVVVVHPLYVGGIADGDPPVGFVATGIALADLLDSLAATLPAGTNLALREEGEVIAVRGGPVGTFARTVDVNVPGRQWRLTVNAPERPEQVVAMAVLGGGIAAGLWLLVVFVTTLRYQRRMARANRSLARAENRSRTLERLGSTLSQSLSGVEVARALLESVPRLTGVSAGAVAVLSDDGSQLVLIDAVGYDDGRLAQLGRVPLDGSVLGEVMRTGEPAWLPSPLAWRDDPLAGRFAEVGRAAAIVPLMADRPVGLLVLVQPNVRTFIEDERSLVMTVAALAARALDRSLRYDAEHATAVAFQQASLPVTLPVAPGVAVAARYRPATRLASVGGDWYDMLSLDDGRVAVIVGDVVGHGVDAAAAMGQLRVAVRVLAGVDAEPAPLLRMLGGQVSDIPGALYATLAYGIVDVGAGRFSYLLAGHPPPVLLRADGRATLLDSVPWPPVGIVPPTEPADQAVPIGPGDRLLLYTDGVVERRDESLTVGLERLRAAAEALGDLDPDDLCDALLETVVPSDDQADDVAMLVVQVLPAER